MRESFTLIAAAVMAATSAAAEERSGVYVGGDAGQSNWNVTQSEANDLAAFIGDELGNGFSKVAFAEGKSSDTDFT